MCHCLLHTTASSRLMYAYAISMDQKVTGSMQNAEFEFSLWFPIIILGAWSKEFWVQIHSHLDNWLLYLLPMHRVKKWLLSWSILSSMHLCACVRGNHDVLFASTASRSGICAHTHTQAGIFIVHMLCMHAHMIKYHISKLTHNQCVHEGLSPGDLPSILCELHNMPQRP